jgi:hypothetical protein
VTGFQVLVFLPCTSVFVACFRAGARIGPVTRLPVTGQVAALAATGDTVYVSAAPAGGYATGITAYRVPAACR